MVCAVFFVVDECSGQMELPFGEDANDVEIEKTLRRADKLTAAQIFHFAGAVRGPITNYNLFPEARTTDKRGLVLSGKVRDRPALARASSGVGSPPLRRRCHPKRPERPQRSQQPHPPPVVCASQVRMMGDSLRQSSPGTQSSPRSGRASSSRTNPAAADGTPPLLDNLPIVGEALEALSPPPHRATAKGAPYMAECESGALASSAGRPQAAAGEAMTATPATAAAAARVSTEPRERAAMLLSTPATAGATASRAHAQDATEPRSTRAASRAAQIAWMQQAMASAQADAM